MDITVESISGTDMDGTLCDCGQPADVQVLSHDNGAWTYACLAHVQAAADEITN